MFLREVFDISRKLSTSWWQKLFCGLWTQSTFTVVYRSLWSVYHRNLRLAHHRRMLCVSVLEPWVNLGLSAIERTCRASNLAMLSDDKVKPVLKCFHLIDQMWSYYSLIVSDFCLVRKEREGERQREVERLFPDFWKQYFIRKYTEQIDVRHSWRGRGT